MKFERERVASTSSSEGIDQKIVYFNLILRPLGGIKQKYKED